MDRTNFAISPNLKVVHLNFAALWMPNQNNVKRAVGIRPNCSEIPCAIGNKVLESAINLGNLPGFINSTTIPCSQNLTCFQTPDISGKRNCARRRDRYFQRNDCKQTKCSSWKKRKYHSICTHKIEFRMDLSSSKFIQKTRRTVKPKGGSSHPSNSGAEAMNVEALAPRNCNLWIKSHLQPVRTERITAIDIGSFVAKLEPALTLR